MKPPQQPEEKGAPAALRFLEAREAASRANVEKLSTEYLKAQQYELDQPPEMDGADFLNRTKAIKQHLDRETDDYLKLAKSLREFSKAVDPDKRDNSESITRADGEKVFRMMAIYCNTAVENFSTRIISEIRDAPSETEAYEITSTVMKESLVNSIKSAVGENHLAPWCLAAVEDIL